MRRGVQANFKDAANFPASNACCTPEKRSNVVADISLSDTMRQLVNASHTQEVKSVRLKSSSSSDDTDHTSGRNEKTDTESERTRGIRRLVQLSEKKSSFHSFSAEDRDFFKPKRVPRVQQVLSSDEDDDTDADDSVIVEPQSKIDEKNSLADEVKFRPNFNGAFKPFMPTGVRTTSSEVQLNRRGTSQKTEARYSKVRQALKYPQHDDRLNSDHYSLHKAKSENFVESEQRDEVNMHDKNVHSGINFKTLNHQPEHAESHLRSIYRSIPPEKQKQQDYSLQREHVKNVHLAKGRWSPFEKIVEESPRHASPLLVPPKKDSQCKTQNTDESARLKSNNYDKHKFLTDDLRTPAEPPKVAPSISRSSIDVASVGMQRSTSGAQPPLQHQERVSFSASALPSSFASVTAKQPLNNMQVDAEFQKPVTSISNPSTSLSSGEGQSLGTMPQIQKQMSASKLSSSSSVVPINNHDGQLSFKDDMRQNLHVVNNDASVGSQKSANVQQTLLNQRQTSASRLPTLSSLVETSQTTKTRHDTGRTAPLARSQNLSAALAESLSVSQQENKPYSIVHNGVPMALVPASEINKDSNKDLPLSHVNQVPIVNISRQQQKFGTVTVSGKTYTLFKMIGKGGSSKVYMVLDSENKRNLALKCVDLEGADEKTIQLYINEIYLLKRLQYSDRVIKLYDYEYKPEKNCLYVVMECGDTDLASWLNSRKKKGENSMEMRKFYWSEMLKAVAVIHKEGIVHSDLKPANFVLVHGDLKLIDFGIANAIQTDKTSVTKDCQVGTLSFMSPEAVLDVCDTPADADGKRKKRYKISVKSDVWSLGCILYNIVYGKTPFGHITNIFAKLQALSNPEYEISFPDCGEPELVDTLKHCLQRDPKCRASIDELLSHPYLQQKQPVPTATVGVTEEKLKNFLVQLSQVNVNSPRTLSTITRGVMQHLQTGQDLDAATIFGHRTDNKAASPRLSEKENYRPV